MRIKKLTDGSVLERGQLLVVLHCLNRCGSDALFDLRKSIRIGVVQFYRHRQEAVPWISRSKNGKLVRHPRTTNKRRARFSNETTEEILESHGLAFKLRQEPKFESVAQRPRRFISPVSAKLEGTSRSTAKDRRLHQPPNPQPSLLGLVKFGGPCLTMLSGKYRRGYLELSTWRR
jgi:hypothetical protein